MALDDLPWLFSVHLHGRINMFGEYTKIGEETVIISSKYDGNEAEEYHESAGSEKFMCWPICERVNAKIQFSQNTIHKC
jgi:hypothetical protein